jgi:hypothetical protein
LGIGGIMFFGISIVMGDVGMMGTMLGMMLG